MDKNVRKHIDTTGIYTIPEYAKTGLDMANFFGVTQNGNKIDYGDFFKQMIKFYVLMTWKEQMLML